MNPIFPGTVFPPQPTPSLSGNFATYAGFRTRVMSYIDTDGADFDPGLVDDLILIGEKRINREVRCREMESPLSIRVDNGRAPIPKDYLELMNAHTLLGGHRFVIERVDLNTLQSRHTAYFGTNGPCSTIHAYGGPITMARDGDTFVFGPNLVDGTVVSGTYYIRFTPLKDRPGDLLDPDSDSYQRLYAEHPDLYLYAVLGDPEMLIGRPTRAQQWEARYGNLKTMLKTQSQQERYSGGPIRIRAR